MQDTILSLFDDPETAFGIGVLGAFAGFSRAADEPLQARALTRVTARGGVSLRLDLDEPRLIAWEETTDEPHRWRQAAALILPEEEASIGGNAVVTEIGPDNLALREQDRSARLFDLGLGFRYLRACIRTADTALINILRDNCGGPLFEKGNPLPDLLRQHSPHRVFWTKLARVEVYQPIPAPGGRTPEGPHTHLSPELLETGLPHAETSPIPEGWISVLDLFPAHPLRNQFGAPRSFDAGKHAAFQGLLARYGLPELLAAKQEARRTGAEAGADSFAREASRVALRQMAVEGGA